MLNRKDILATHFPESTIEVQSDLVGAARALCGNAPGIACILGTGSNSCYYDGKQIFSNISPLGFILGDEGSGAVLGKRLVGDCLKNQLPKDICDAFLQTFKLTPAQIIEKVYRQPQANRFLASLDKQTRIIFLQRYWYICTAKEIARNVGLSESNVNVILHRTRNRLKLFLQKEGISV